MRKLDLNAAEMAIVMDENVIAAWVFGSAQGGEVEDESDLDIALLCHSAPTLDNLAELRSHIQKALGFEDIDIVVINNSSPILRFEALEGRRLFSRNPAQVAAFQSLTAREYEDEMALSRRHLSSAA